MATVGFLAVALIMASSDLPVLGQESCSPWIYNLETKKCYKKFCDVRYANTAEDACKKNGGHLVTICSEEENTFVGYMANFQNDYYNNRINTWIGLYRDPKNKNNWLWKSGETCGYRNWHQHEPNNEGGNEENVHFFSSHDQLTWNDNQKEEYFYYICERKTCPLDDQ